MRHQCALTRLKWSVTLIEVLYFVFDLMQPFEDRGSYIVLLGEFAQLFDCGMLWHILAKTYWPFITWRLDKVKV